MKKLLKALYKILVEDTASKFTLNMFRDLNKRQIELWEILNQYLPKDYVPYSTIVDIAKNNVSHLYNDFGAKFPLRCTSSSLLNDLENLVVKFYLKQGTITHPKFSGYRIGHEPIELLITGR